ncbi:MAG: hypothetical protein WAR59_13740 [Ignavibacteriaceae bacterium]
MRLVAFVSILCFLLGCAGSNNTLFESGKINGSWIPIQQEFAGTSLPASAFEKQKLIITDSAYTLIAESVDKGIVKYDNNKMDIYGKEGVNAGKHFTAIYKYENEQLTICYNLKGDSYPVTFDTKGKPMFFLSVFRKESVK